MKKVIIVDWLDKYGGAERVISMLQKVFNFSETYTLTNIMSEDDLAKIYHNQPNEIYTSPLKRTGKFFRYFFIAFPYFISKIEISKDARLIISSSHAVAKGINKSHPEQIHISYFQARNCNYIWDEAKLYFGKAYYIFYPLIKLLRKWDIAQAQKPDYIISNSQFVQKWVKETYGRDTTVIYPPVDLSKFNLCETKEDYYVAIGRMAHIKRFDVLIEAFRKNGRKLILIGDGDLYEKFKANLPENITMPGFLNSEEVSVHLEKAKAFIQVGIEGFGIASIESQACGTPVIAYREGGVLETVIENESGIFFDNQTVESLNKAIIAFEKKNFNPKKIREFALRFSQERFALEILNFVKSKV
ncbi:MAG: glycosyltransferase [Weeksellaceae bacterium]